MCLKKIGPSQHREGAQYLADGRSSSVKRACRVASVHRSMWYHRSRLDDLEVEQKLAELAHAHPTRRATLELVKGIEDL